MKKRLCFTGYNISTCAHIRQQFEHYLGSHLELLVWCLSSEEFPEGFDSCDLFVASSNTVLARVDPRLPAGATILVADRTINTENLDLLLDLAPGARALVVGTSAETAGQAVATINSFGFDYLDLVPYHPGDFGPPPEDIRMAITMGNVNLVSEGMEQCINLGVRGIDLSTYVQIVHLLRVPVEALNAISYDYVEALLGVPAGESLGRNIARYLPQIDFATHLKTGEPITDDIRRFGDTHLIVSGTPILEEGESASGLVVTLSAITEVEELETKVRRELKRRGNVARYTFADVIGDSDLLREGIALARRFAATEMTVLLEGESGTGKELFAQAFAERFSGRALRIEAPLALEAREGGLPALVDELATEREASLAAFLLSEMHRSTASNRGVGRSSILRKLKGGDGATSEYRLRSLLKRLESAGCVDTGVTKQGRRITARSEELLAMLDHIAVRAC